MCRNLIKCSMHKSEALPNSVHERSHNRSKHEIIEQRMICCNSCKIADSSLASCWIFPNGNAQCVLCSWPTVYAMHRPIENDRSHWMRNAHHGIMFMMDCVRIVLYAVLLTETITFVTNGERERWTSYFCRRCNRYFHSRRTRTSHVMIVEYLNMNILIHVK